MKKKKFFFVSDDGMPINKISREIASEILFDELRQRYSLQINHLGKINCGMNFLSGDM